MGLDAGVGVREGVGFGVVGDWSEEGVREGEGEEGRALVWMGKKVVAVAEVLDLAEGE